MAKIQTVDAFLDALEHPRKPEILALRQAILQSHENVSESVKWNAPNFRWLGEDRVTMRLQPGNRLELVLHRGATKVAEAMPPFPDPHGLIAWAASDRGVISIADQQMVNRALDSIVDTVVRWMQAAQ